jgi:hypothetical protein
VARIRDALREKRVMALTVDTATPTLAEAASVASRSA